MSGKLPPQPWIYADANAEELNDGNGDLVAHVYHDGLADAIQGIPALIAALKVARHALTTLHGLTAADGASPAETWTIDERSALAEIDAALLVAPSAGEGSKT